MTLHDQDAPLQVGHDLRVVESRTAVAAQRRIAIATAIGDLLRLVVVELFTVTFDDEPVVDDEVDLPDAPDRYLCPHLQSAAAQCDAHAGFGSRHRETVEFANARPSGLPHQREQVVDLLPGEHTLKQSAVQRRDELVPAGDEAVLQDRVANRDAPRGIRRLGKALR